ncbi:MAG: hypothetical protein KBG49_07510 [Spirochaetes bacterium]|nr:hypothetical protein [Spirochaetota bacterium]
MPFTPFHWGPSSWLGVLLFKIFDFPTLLISSVIIDIEPFFVMVFNLPLPLHGFLHTFLGGSIMAVLTAIGCYFLKEPFTKITSLFRLAQHSSFKKIIFTSFFGVYSHIVLDAFLYSEMQPFYPLKDNPFLGVFSSLEVYLFCGTSFIIGICVYVARLILTKRKRA